MSDEQRVVLWNAINRLVVASGGSDSSTSVRRQHAVVDIERVIKSILAAKDAEIAELRAIAEEAIHEIDCARVSTAIGDGFRARLEKAGKR